MTDKDLPGELQGAERIINFFDLEGAPVTYEVAGQQLQYAIRRLFVQDVGFLAGIEPTGKYLSPKDQPLHLYYPQNKKGFDWKKWARDPSQRKIFVEGATKVACAVSFGFLAVGIQGCWGWSDSKHGHPLLLDFDEYVFEGCDVYWVPDRDRKPKAVQDVFQSGEAFAFLLKERGARVHIVELPFLSEGKVGVDDFLCHFSETLNKKAAQEALEKRLAETVEWEDHELNDGGNARRWVKMCGHRFRHAGKRWLEYARGCWKDDGLLQHQETLIEMLEEMMTSARRNGNDALRKAIKPYITRPHIASSLALAESDPAVASTPNQFDKQPLWINCKDRTVELPTRNRKEFEMLKEANNQLKMHNHRPEDMLTRQMGANFVAKAPCPTWRSAMDDWAEPDLQRTLQQLFGMTLTGNTDVQKLVILHGPGATGKSTMMEVAKAVFGSYATSVPSDTLMVDRHGAMEERKLATLPGVRLVCCSETRAGSSMDENFIKKLTGGDTLVARKLYGEAFNFNPEFHIWLTTNNRPVVRDTSDATWRRFIMIPFDKVVPESKRDPALKEKLLLELDGILWWMIQGYLDYIANDGLYLAKVVKDDLNHYRLEQDDMAQFFEDACKFGPSYSIGRNELYRAYTSWCEVTKRRPLNNKLFKKELTERFKDRIAEKQMGPKGMQEWKWKGVDTQVRLSFKTD